MKFKVGDTIEFIGGIKKENRIPSFSASNLPQHLIKHGQTIYKKNEGKIIAIVEEGIRYYIVRYEDETGSFVQLGFTASALKRKEIDNWREILK